MSTVLMLHRFEDPARPATSDEGSGLRAVLATLRRQGVELLPLPELITRMEQRIPARGPTVTFTVDDGYHDFGTVAAPIFAEFDSPVTVFLSTDIVTVRGWYWWDRLEYAVNRTPLRELVVELDGAPHRFVLGDSEQRQQMLESLIELVKFASDGERQRIARTIGEIAEVEVPERPPEHYRTLTWDEVRGLERSGVGFGPHSCSHPIFSRIDEDTARREITESWAAMRRECAAPQPIFCYPNGTSASFGERDMRLVREAGLRGAATYLRARISTRAAGPMDPYRLPRFEMPHDPFDVAWLAAAIRARP